MRRQNHLLSRMQFDHVLKLAQENGMLFRAERKLMLRMAYIQQGRYETDQIAALVPFRVRTTFRDHVARGDREASRPLGTALEEDEVGGPCG